MAMTMDVEEYAPTNTNNSNTQLLEELEALSQTLYQSHTRRTSSLALLRRPSIPPPLPVDSSSNDSKDKPRTRRMSFSPWRSRSHSHSQTRPTDQIKHQAAKRNDVSGFVDNHYDPSSDKRGGVWNWKPIRALSHIGMQKMNCLFSVEVVSVQGLPATMNGLRLSVCVRKRETKDGAVHTMPSRVSQGVADFEETLFIRCHVYCSQPIGGGNGQPKFEARPFLIYAFAADAHELDFGTSSVDLGRMIDESIRMSSEGNRVRQWDVSFNLSGKAEGGKLVLKLGFQLMEKERGIGIHSQSGNARHLASLSARRHSKGSFSIASPRLSEDWRLSKSERRDTLQVIDDDPAVELLDFDVVDKGVEYKDQEQSEKKLVVKEVVQDRLSELNSIAQQIKALESIVEDDKPLKKTEEEGESQRLDSDEETVSKEFLQMLEDEDAKKSRLNQVDHIPSMKLDDSEQGGGKVFLPDLGKALGCVVQTKDGGYLSSMNPLDIEMEKKETPKLAMQTSKPLILTSISKSLEGFELFHRIAGLGFEALTSEISSLMPMDEIMGKTAEQVAFEGIASAIINGRNKEGASSTAARTISSVKTMATAMTNGRSERISTGLWNVGKDPQSIEETLAFSMQKIEEIAMEALKIQAEMAEEDAPFDVSPKKDENQPLASLISSEKSDTSSPIAIIVVLQLRDPIRRYEAVGGPMIALINATRIDDDDDDDDDENEERRLKIGSLHVGGMKVRSRGKSEMQRRLTAMQWLIGNGLVGKKRKQLKASSSSKGEDLFWSISSRVVADMWLKPVRNPNVKLTH